MNSSDSEEVPIIKGFHGTVLRAAEAIRTASEFRLSKNEHDWLGRGAYFFQDAPIRAGLWAERESQRLRRKEGDSRDLAPAVVAARIRLLNCLDLLDVRWFRYLALAYREMSAEYRHHGQRIPTQKAPHLTEDPLNPDEQERELEWAEKGVGRNRLDYEVINYLVDNIEENGGRPIKTVRAAFAEGRPAYKASFLFNRSHVQIAVIDLSAIQAGSVKIIEKEEWDKSLCDPSKLIKSFGNSFRGSAP